MADDGFLVGGWLVRPQLNQIQREGEVRKIEPKVMDVLAYLARHPDEVLSKEQIISEVWSEAFVGDEVLAYSISELRRALGDDARDPAFIETIPRRGYRLIAEVSFEDRSAKARYQLVREIGRGAIGEVHLARDEVLKRQVALKFLLPELEEDDTARQRFLREARSAAALSHPNICTVHDTGQLDERSFIAMEYVEGETLKQRIERRPLPVDEGLAIARQMADALIAAHKKGIIHRDIKPSNVILSADGRVAITDFGIARRLKTSALEGTDWSDTLTKNVSALGTVPYMSPEQLRGQEADARSDIFSFGVVLYEMLTGVHPFKRNSTVDTSAAIISEDPPPLTQAVNDLAAGLEPLLHKMLAKNPDQRQLSMTEVKNDLERQGAAPTPVTSALGANGRRWAFRLTGLAGLLFAAAVILALWALFQSLPPGSTEPVRMTVTLPEGVNVTSGPGFGHGSSVAVSPDGRTLVIAGTDEDGQRLYQRRLDRLEVTPLPGTMGGSTPFFSPDGVWIGFFAGGRLKRVPAGGGGAVDIVALPGYPASGFPDGASWSPDDRIFFASGARSPVHWVGVRTGGVEPVTTFNADEVDHSNPTILPNGRTLLFESNEWIHGLDLVSGRRTRLVQGTAPRYATTGHLILIRDAALLAAPFDSSHLELAGPVVSLTGGIAGETSEETGVHERHYAISAVGTLSYVPAGGEYMLVLVDSDGAQKLVSQEGRRFENPQFSPNGHRLAVAAVRHPGEPTDVWIHDLELGSASRLTFEGGRAPVWKPDGTAVTFSHLGERQGIYQKAADGTGEIERLLSVAEFHWLVGWTPDGRTLVYGVIEGVQKDRTSPSSIMALTDGKSRRVLGPGQLWGGRLSPDGRWLAYYTLEAGRFEVYVTPFPKADTRWLISQDGGRDPSWSPDGTELYYRNGDRLQAARIDTEGGIRVRSHRLVVESFSPPLYDDYDIHPDGRTLALVQPIGNSERREVTIVLNWFEELKRRVPVP